VREPLTQARLKELLTYDPETGDFFWIANPRRRALPEGNKAGTTNESRGCRQIGINQRFYRSHRLAWLYMTGEWPKHEIDHIDGNPSNNCFSNLRDVPRGVNQQNIRKPLKNNSVGYLGVKKVNNRFAARLWANKVQHHLGYFATPEEAHAAYLIAKRRMHPGCTI
jgi:hypothetical protein